MATKWISPTWRMPDEQNQSKFENYSMSFDGTEFINCGNIISLQNTSVLTISMWFNFNTLTTQRMLGHYTTNNGITIESDSSFFYFVIANSSLTYATLPITGNVTINNWFNIIMVYDGNQSTNETKLKVYLNNQQKTLTYVGTIPTSLAVNNSANLRLGSTASGFIDMDGKLDQVAIFDYALTQAQVNYLYNSGTPVNPMAISGNAPIAYYPLGGSSTGSSSTLTTPNKSVADATVFDFVPNDFINCGNNNSLNIYNNITISAWIKADSFGAYNLIIGRSTNKDYDFGVYSTSSGGAMRLHSGNGSQENVVSTGTFLNTGEWYHLAVTRTVSPNQAIFFINGQQLNTASLTKTPIGSTDITRIGSRSGSFSFDGKISNVSIWNTNLSTPEIATLYNYGSPLSGTQPQAANLRAWYKMGIDTSNWDGSNWVIGDSVSQFATAYSIPNTNNDNNVSPYGGNSKLISGGSFLSVADSILAPSASVLSISCWVKLDNPDVNFYDNIISQVNGATAHSFRIMKWRNNGTGNWTFGTINFALYSNDTTAVNVNVDKAQFTPQANTWFNIICTYDGTTMRVFINNKLCGSGTSMSGDFAGNTNNRFIIGKNANSIYGGLQGAVSNVQVWNSTLTGGNGLSVGDQGVGEIAQLYNNGTPLASSIPQASSLLGWWKLESDLNDYSGNNKTLTAYGNEGGNANSISPVPSAISSLVSTLNGTSSGMTTANLVNSDLTRSIPYSSYSMSFDGAAEDIRCGNSLGSSLSQADYVTVSCWVYFNDITDEQGLWSFRSGDNTNDTATSLSLYDSGATLRLAYYEGGNNGRVTISNPGFSNENWYNIVCVYDKGAAGKIYINGQAQTVVDSGVYSTVDFSSDNFYIGSYYSSTYATNGNLSNIAVWNLELTSDQVLTVYNGGVPNDILSLSPIRWWSLSGDSYFDGNNFICPNLTSSSNNGTSHNLGSTDLIGEGPGSTANGTATSMNIPANLQGNAPNSTKNAFSINMTETDRETSVPS